MYHFLIYHLYLSNHEIFCETTIIDLLMECSHAVMHLPLNLLEGSDRSTIKFVSDGSIIDFSNIKVLC